VWGALALAALLVLAVGGWKVYDRYGPWGEPRLRVMLLGDSITAAWAPRRALWELIRDAGFRDVDFVGKLKEGNRSFDGDHNGYGWYVVRDVLKPAGTAPKSGAFFGDARDLAMWFDGLRFDVVLMHFGTNDLSNDAPPDEILRAYDAILEALRQRNPRVTLLVAQVIPLAPRGGCGHCAAAVARLNAAIPGWAASRSRTASPVVVVDQFSGFDARRDSGDGIHPNDAGGARIAARWFGALQPILQAP
jgi:lysophospholipase L1-like esterase